MATQTRTFPLSLTPSTTATVVELAHFRDITLGTDETVGIYLESFFLNFSLRSFALMVFPDYEGDETENEKIIKFNTAETKSQKLGLRILTRKNNTGNWREKAEIILTNGSRKSYRDILKPFLTQGGVRLFENNDAIGIQLVDYGNGLLKQADFIEIEVCFTVDFQKKNNGVEALQARIEALELALDNKLTNLPANTLLGRTTTAGTVQVIAQSTLFANSPTLTSRSGATALDFNLIPSTSFSSTRWIDGNAGHLNLPSGITSGHFIQSDSLFGTPAVGLYCHQIFLIGNRRWERQENNGTWGAWREVSFLS